MPNHVTNILTASGAAEAVKSFFAAIDGGVNEDNERLHIDFEKSKPMPESLDMESGSRSDRGLDYYVIKLSEQSGTAAAIAALGGYARFIFARLPETLKRQREGKDAGDMPELLKLGEQCYNNIRDYGAPTWYEWCTQNRGTKWNAYSQERPNDNTIRFQTAWAGVPELMRELSERHPGVTLSYSYADEEWGRNVGDFEFENGNANYVYTPQGGSPGARRIAEEILGPCPWENSSERESEAEDEWADEL
jgi:hypothetical protein